MTRFNIRLVEFGSESKLGAQLAQVLSGIRHTEYAFELDVVSAVQMAGAARERDLCTGSHPAVVILLCEFASQLDTAGAVLKAMRRDGYKPPSIVVGPMGSPEPMAKLFQLGADDVWALPLRAVEVVGRVIHWATVWPEQQQIVQRLKEKLGLQVFVGESPTLLAELEKIPALARCDVNVLIGGETGTGKEICARAIHFLSPRSGKPFIPINCGSLPTELIENELFGHEPGAFTSANTSSAGLIREADGGVLFLDEIDSLPLAAQSKLLRFLQDKEFRSLGSRKLQRADVRILAATNITLEDAVRAGRFRRDLYYRLNVVPLTLPPLRERTGDACLLAVHFLTKFAAEYRKEVHGFTHAALQKLVVYHWPGNVRELENVVARAVVLSQHRQIDASDIVLGATESMRTAQTFKTMKAQFLADFERNYLTGVLLTHEGNISRAAEASGKDRRAFWELLRKHGMAGGQSSRLTA